MVAHVLSLDSAKMVSTALVVFRGPKSPAGSIAETIGDVNPEPNWHCEYFMLTASTLYVLHSY